MKVAEDHAVYFNYKLTNDQGEVLDSSEGSDPLAYLHGHGNIIPGLEEAMVDKEQGAEFDVEIPPAKAYGEQNDELIQKVPKNLFQDAPNLEPGMQFQAQTPQGPHVFTVKEVDDNEVTIDGNHMLAGETLHFHIEITEVREASDEEKEHGHIHGAGGHQH